MSAKKFVASWADPPGIARSSALVVKADDFDALVTENAQLRYERDAWRIWAEHIDSCVDCGEGDYCYDGETLREMLPSDERPSSDPTEQRT